MALTARQKKLLSRRTTPSSKKRLRQSPAFRRRGQPAKAKPKPRAKAPAKRKPQGSGLYNPARPLSGGNLRRAANQLTASEFGEAQRGLDREIDRTQRQGLELTSRASDYYTQLAKEQEGAVARSQAIGQGLQSSLGQIGSQSQATLSQIEQEAIQRAAADEEVRGSGLSGGGADAVAREVAAQRALAATGTQQAQQAGALSTTNWENLANVANIARGVAGGEAVQRLGMQTSAQLGELRGRRQDLSRQVAARRMDNLLKLRQTGFENTLAARGLDIDLAEIEADMQQSRADNRLARQRIRSSERQNRQRLRIQARGQNISAQTQRRGQDITRQNNIVTSRDRRRGQDISAAQRAADRRVRQQIADSKKRAGRPESSDSRKMRAGIGNALADLRAGKEKRVKKDAPPLVYQAAKDIRTVGFVRPTTLQSLRNSGMRVPQSWLPPSRRRGYRAPRSNYNKGNVPG